LELLEIAVADGEIYTTTIICKANITFSVDTILGKVQVDGKNHLARAFAA
jgi:hypothetical protein